jgi:hypothetical protein
MKVKLGLLAAFVLTVTTYLGVSSITDEPTQVTFLKKERYYNEGMNKTYLLIYSQNTDSLIRGKIVDKETWTNTVLNKPVQTKQDNSNGIGILCGGLVISGFIFLGMFSSENLEEEKDA